MSSDGLLDYFDTPGEALRATLTAWAVAEVRGDQARVSLSPDPDTLARLRAVKAARDPRGVFRSNRPVGA